jgi:hypothetical protein
MPSPPYVTQTFVRQHSSKQPQQHSCVFFESLLLFVKDK